MLQQAELSWVGHEAQYDSLNPLWVFLYLGHFSLHAYKIKVQPSAPIFVHLNLGCESPMEPNQMFACLYHKMLEEPGLQTTPWF